MAVNNKNNRSKNSSRTSKKNSGNRVQKTARPKKRSTSTTRGSNRVNRKSKQPKHLKEIALISLFVVSVFLIFSLYFDLGGKLGRWISGITFGAFGLAAYLVPLYFLFLSIYKLLKKSKKQEVTVVNNKFMISFLFIIIVSTLSHIYYISSSQINKDLFDKNIFLNVVNLYYNMSKASKTFGGIIGGILGDSLVMLLGKVIANLFLIAVLIIIFILVTEKSFINILAMFGSKVKEQGSKANDKIKEIKANKQEKVKDENIKTEKVKKVKKELTADKIKKKLSVNPFEKFKFKKNKKSTIPNHIISPQDTAGSGDSKDIPKEMYVNAILEDGVVKWEFTGNKEEEPDYEVIGKENNSEQVNAEQNEEISEVKSENNEINNMNIESENLEDKSERKQSIGDEYEFPPMNLLNSYEEDNGVSRMDVEMKATKLVETLKSFGVDVTLLDMKVGPSVTRYELQPNVGVKVSKILNLQDDIALSLAASGIRMEAPIPGKSAIGIEVPNDKSSNVYLKDVLKSKKFNSHPSNVAVALGVDIAGEPIVADIARMPHLLIAGATGSGKSVCINTIIISLLYKANPNAVKIIMIDPKVVELKVYNEIPHLLIPVVTDPTKASMALNWAVHEMNERYKKFAEYNVRDINGYNMLIDEASQQEVEGEEKPKKMPQLVIIIDELADLMMAAPSEVETAIIRLAQMARAAGIHLIIATQRPSVNVITGLIKANVPSRIAFNVSSGVDSRTIIDTVGAEKLLGKGDMLFSPVGMQKPLRVQGAFVSDGEVKKIVDFLKEETKQYNDKVVSTINNKVAAASFSDDRDEYFEEVVKFVIEKDRASASMIQRYFKVGFPRAARIMDQLTETGIVSDEDGSKSRKVLVTLEQYESMKNNKNNSDDREKQE